MNHHPRQRLAVVLEPGNDENCARTFPATAPFPPGSNAHDSSLRAHLPYVETMMTGQLSHHERGQIQSSLHTIDWTDYHVGRSPSRNVWIMMNDDIFDTSTAAQLRELSDEHRDLDEAIARLTASPNGDELLVRRMKKRKLALKDRIAILERQLEPDDLA
jgi:hypothetical protein